MKMHAQLIGALCCALWLSMAGCAPMMPAPPSGNWQAQQPATAAPAPSPAAGHDTASPVAAPATDYFQSPPRIRPTAPTPAAAESAGKRVSLNLQDAEVRSVVDTVLGDVLKRNYTVAPQVSGKITLRTGQAIEPEALLSVLEAALGSVSAALIETDGSYHVIPLDAAPSRARALVRNPGQASTAGYAIEVVPLNFARAREVQKLLDAIGPKGAVLLADEQHNHLVIGGTRQDRAALARTIAGFDVDGMRGMVFALYRLEQVGAEQVVNELRQVFGAQQDLFTPGLRLLPLERMQAVIGIAKHPSELEAIEAWIRRLDSAPKTGERSLRVYNVQNGSARDLASSLQLVLTGEGAASPPPARETSPQAPGAHEPTRAAPAAMTSLKSASRIVANEENNSLLIFSSESEWRLLRDALAKLDVMPRQVMIEAILAEVSLNDSLRYGVQWFFESGGKTASLSTNDQGKIGPQFPGFSYFYPGNDSARAVVNALQSHTDVKVLSAPRLAVLNNQKASLQVGDEVPVRTQTSQAVGNADAPVISTIAMRETGVLLEVTPRVNDNGNVILEVTQEVSDVTTTTSSGIDSPTIARRRLRSVIATRDGATVALGGLIRENSQRGNSGVPLLKDLPAVGGLFRDNTRDTRRTELVVLLVPRVMRNHLEPDAVVDALLHAMTAAAEVASHAAPLKHKPAANTTPPAP